MITGFDGSMICEKIQMMSGRRECLKRKVMSRGVPI